MKHSELTSYLAAVVKHNLEVAQKEQRTGRLADVNEFIVPFIIGDPGVGKTAAPKQVARSFDLPYYQTIVAQYDAGEMAGLPFIGDKEMHDETGAVIGTEKVMIRLRPAYLPGEHEIGIYNLDELPQAFLANQNICSQIVNEWRVGDHHISRGITIVATGNKPENKAGTTTMPTHLRDRLQFIELEVDADDWLKYSAETGGNPKIRAFIRNNPGKLHKFDVGANSNPTPRSWEKMSAILAMDLPQNIRTQAIAGQIGAGVGTEFETWLRVEDRMPDVDEVIAHPEKAPLFGNQHADVAYLLMAALADKTTGKNVENVIKYIRRMPNQEFAAYWATDAFSRDKTLLQTKAVTQWKMTDGAKLAF